MIVECDSLEVINLVNQECPSLHYTTNMVRKIQLSLKDKWNVKVYYISHENNSLANDPAHIAQKLHVGLLFVKGPLNKDIDHFAKGEGSIHSTR